jgi:arabinose-5-phosphate isomerase
MQILDTARKVLEIEAKAILTAIGRLNADFEKAVNILFNTSGRIIVTGMGKSGIIARKISATLTSTGTPSEFLHPSEALHGDIGMIRENDVVLALSTSGETFEVIRLLAHIKRIGIKLITLVGNPRSSLAKESDVFLDCSVEKEACPIGLVPSTSTTLTLAVGDALAIALMEKKGFSEEEFKYYHPGGSIGKKLLKVKHLMHSGKELPIIDKNLPMTEAINIINQKRFGMGIVVNSDSQVHGIITDGDLRRLFLKQVDFSQSKVSECMKTNPFCIRENNLAVEALKILEENLITSLIVTDEKDNLKGLLHLHDLWRTEMI